MPKAFKGFNCDFLVDLIIFCKQDAKGFLLTEFSLPGIFRDDPDKFFRLERFSHVIIHPHLKKTFFVTFYCIRSKSNNIGMPSVRVVSFDLTDLFRSLKAVHYRHPYIHQDDFIFFFLKHANGNPSVFGDLKIGKSLLPQGSLCDPLADIIVFDKKDRNIFNIVFLLFLFKFIEFDLQHFLKYCGKPKNRPLTFFAFNTYLTAHQSHQVI